MLKVLFATVFVLWLIACSHSAGPTKSDAGETGASGAPPTGNLVTFSRTGGFAGFNDTLVVGRDGALTLTDKTGTVKRGTAPASEIKELDLLLHSGDFKAAAKSYGSPGGADRMTYTIDVVGGPKLTTMDGVQQPGVISNAIQKLSEMMGEVR